MQLYVVLVLSLAVLIAQSADPVKHLAGPPTDFALYDVPDPAQTLTTERSLSIPIWFDSTLEGDNIFSVTFPVDGPNDFVFSFGSPHEKELELELLDPNGKPVDLQSNAVQSFFPIGTAVKLPVTAYLIKNSMKGVYTFNIKTTTMNKIDIKDLAASPYPNAMVTLLNNDYVQIESHLSSYVVKAGQEIGLVSTIVDSSPNNVVSNIRVTAADLVVTTPDGNELDVPMKDDVEVNGNPPQSGVYSAQLPSKTGQYLLQAKLSGVYQDATLNVDIPFERTTQHFLEVSGATVELSGSAALRPVDAEHVLIDIGVTNIASAQPQLRAYAQVWGTDPATKALVAACWIGGLVDINANAVTLELNTLWLQKAGVQGPLTLKGVYLADISTSFMVATFEGDIPVDHSSELALELTPEMRDMVVTQEMLFGVNPLPPRNVTLAGSGTLMMLSGYCSDNPWARNPQDFTNALYLVDRGNYANNVFAQKVMDFAKKNNLQSFAIIGHSQGGMVGVHVKNYYWTAMDQLGAGRQIQSVGTPYQGCSGAGSGANFVKIFGVGCGANNDLTPDGATAWLTGISKASRDYSFYYTTTYQQGNLFGDYCNMAVNLLLKWPNDGVTELNLANLPNGGTKCGNKDKWCHTTDMSYPAQYDDHARNQEMNRLAAR